MIEKRIFFLFEFLKRKKENYRKAEKICQFSQQLYEFLATESFANLIM
jgi:hypothetical protein